MCIRKSKSQFHGMNTYQDSKALKRAQDVYAAKSGIIVTMVTMIPFLPSLVTPALPHSLIVEAATWVQYTCFWVFPLVSMMRNTALKRALACCRMDVAKLIRRARN